MAALALIWSVNHVAFALTLPPWLARVERFCDGVIGDVELGLDAVLDKCVQLLALVAHGSTIDVVNRGQLVAMFDRPLTGRMMGQEFLELALVRSQVDLVAGDDVVRFHVERRVDVLLAHLELTAVAKSCPFAVARSGGGDEGGAVEGGCVAARPKGVVGRPWVVGVVGLDAGVVAGPTHGMDQYVDRWTS